MVQWTRSTAKVKHTFLFPSLRTDMVDSPELERGVTTTSIAKDHSRLEILTSFLKSK